MSDREKTRRAVYLAAIGIVVAALFLNVQSSPYFPLFVLACMVFAAADLGYRWMEDRKRNSER